MSVAALHPLLLSLSLSNATFFGTLRLDLADGLNCLLGGRGTGKSAILHILRFALGHRIPEAYAEEHAEYIAEVLGDGTAEVAFQTQHGARYTASRTRGSEPVVRNAEGEIVSVSLDGDLFKIEAYAQNEIEGIARSPKAQRDLIDGFVEADIRPIDQSVQQLDRKLTQCAATLRRLADEIAGDAASEAELPSVTEALKGIDLGGSDPQKPDTDRVRAHEARLLRGREQAAMTTLAGELAGVRGALDAFARDALQKLGRAVEGDLERGPRGEAFKRTHAAMQRMAGAIEGAAGRLRADLATAERAAAEEGRALALVHAKEDEAYSALVIRVDADRARAAQSERLHRKLAELSVVAKRLADRRREEGAARDEWNALYAERARLLTEKGGHRKRVADALTRALGPDIQVTVTPGLDTSPVAAVLADILKGANVRPATFVSTIAKRIPPSVLVSMIERNDLEPLVEIDPIKGGKEERASKILALLRASGRLHELALAKPEDAPLIELRLGKKYRASRRLSTGQRCACILPILLLQSTSPLLIDQVEDNLDNAFIYAVVVKRFAQVKRDRQLVVVTHNPNPPTLAGAARILVLGTTEDEDGDGDGDGETMKGQLVAAGTFEEVQAHVESTEGGREAFLERGARYGLLGSRGAS